MLLHQHQSGNASGRASQCLTLHKQGQRASTAQLLHSLLAVHCALHLKYLRSQWLLLAFSVSKLILSAFVHVSLSAM
ncbi:hypothetical protein BDW74DRAFT_158245, partial [Aspergillus multicolor]|uniref:uncharacterized protein n=1 Tax=Aspergillus multicolor TaxID=41759 RepID=UPI003CCE5324